MLPDTIYSICRAFTIDDAEILQILLRVATLFVPGSDSLVKYLVPLNEVSLKLRLLREKVPFLQRIYPVNIK